MSDNQPVLFNHAFSSCSWRVRIALNLKKISYHHHHHNQARPASTDVEKKVKASFAEMNPNQRVPVLFIDGIHISESVAMVEYLEETRPQPPLYPGDALCRHRIRTLVEIMNSYIQPLQNVDARLIVENEYACEAGSADRWATHWATKGFETLEAHMKKWSGRFCVGDELSFADCCLVPQVYSTYRFKFNPQKYATVWAVFSRLEEIPEVQAAHSKRQVDAAFSNFRPF